METRTLIGYAVRRRNPSGFTLVEIAVAVALLGIALTSLIGLHSSYLGNFIRERNRTEAALHAKRLMTALEIASEAPEVGSSEDDLYDKLKEAGIEDTDYLSELRERLKGWTVKVEVTSIDVDPFEDAFRRVDITISWGDKITEQFDLVYFMRPSRK